MNFRLLVATGALVLFAEPTCADGDYVIGDWLGAVWQGPLRDQDTLELDLVRSTVFVEPSRDGSATVRVVAKGDPGSAQIAVTSSENVVRVSDIYPKRPLLIGNLPGECPPPVSDRGDFLSNRSSFITIVKLPPGRQLRVRVMDGDIYVGQVQGKLDVRTNGGTVHRNGKNVARP